MGKTLWKQVGIIIFLLLAFNVYYASYLEQSAPKVGEISYSRFKDELARNNVIEVTIDGRTIAGRLLEEVTTGKPDRFGKTPSFQRFKTTAPPFDDPSLVQGLREHQVEINVVPDQAPSPIFSALIYLLPWVLILGVWWFILKGVRGKGGGGGGIIGSFSKSGAKLFTQENSHVTFDDVAGLEEAKQELLEVVEYLRDPKKFTRVGGKVPRGILLVGPPGTGKTLMAKAVAGEAGVPFFSIVASQFIEMFVGVGASRVRDLFNGARKQAPSIIFIDELDAVGRSRGTGFGGGSDEREQTLNQLLAELDGFDPHEEVIVMSATNRPDVLDPALLRKGRFDRQVVVERPDWRAREAILKVHTRKIPLTDDVDLQILARGTPGMCGADLESLVNEAALLAAREDQTEVCMDHLERAKDRVLLGAERKLILSDEEKRMTAVHEAGHALVAWSLPGADPLHKVTIIPRGQALGVTQQLPVDDRYHYSMASLMTRIAVCLGGRVAERVVFNDFSTGAQNDLKQATDLAEMMVCQWGMSEVVGPVNFPRAEEHPFLGRKLAVDRTFSEQMAWLMDQEIGKLVRRGETMAEEVITGRMDDLTRLSDALLEEEVLDQARIKGLLGDSGNGAPHEASGEEASPGG